MFLDPMSDPRPARRTTTAVAGLWRRFRTWRRERPFWAGAFTMTAGLPIIYFPYTDLDLQGIVLALSTTSGAGSLIIGVLLVVLGLTLWFQQQHRVFAGIAALLLSLTSFPLANFGGLFLGLTCGLVGGSLACAWMPAPDPPTAEQDRQGLEDRENRQDPDGWASLEQWAGLEDRPDRVERGEPGEREAKEGPGEQGEREGKDEQERKEGVEERENRDSRGGREDREGRDARADLEETVELERISAADPPPPAPAQPHDGPH
ncbi:DUF6114 domain-containing protein [Streptomyces sp. NPDC052207]|uniref:DUF6114 domain-containing protein n=1 Tax=Streptomyces sp. NPDC052207 TaxID=3155418 RepID=UPI00342831F2